MSLVAKFFITGVCLFLYWMLLTGATDLLKTLEKEESQVDDS